MKTCCFTGPRIHKLGFSESSPEGIRLKNSIKREIESLYDRGYRRFITGMASGIDTYAAEAVIELKKHFSDVILEAALPYPKMGGVTSDDRIRYERILDCADKTVVLSENYTPYCFHVRNRYMVDESSCLIAYESDSGGTAYTIKYAQKTGKEVIFLTDF